MSECGKAFKIVTGIVLMPFILLGLIALIIAILGVVYLICFIIGLLICVIIDGGLHTVFGISIIAMINGLPEIFQPIIMPVIGFGVVASFLFLDYIGNE